MNTKVHFITCFKQDNGHFWSSMTPMLIININIDTDSSNHILSKYIDPIFVFVDRLLCYSMVSLHQSVSSVWDPHYFDCRDSSCTLSTAFSHRVDEKKLTFKTPAFSSILLHCVSKMHTVWKTPQKAARQHTWFWNTCPFKSTPFSRSPSSVT